MPRTKNLYIHIEDLKSLSINDIKRYLKPNMISEGVVLTYYRNEERTGSIGIDVFIEETEGSLMLDYVYHGNEKIRYEVKLISKPSNLGKGIVWYFVCPETGKICRKLHLKDGRFLHRTAFPDLYYENQVLSSNWRKWSKAAKMVLNEEPYEEYFKKHRKRKYNGVPTKQEIKLQSIIDKKEAFKLESSSFTTY